MRNKVVGYVMLVLVVVFPGFLYGDISTTERAALIELYNSTNGDNWTNNSGWKGNNNEADGFSESGSEGTWYGITVEDIEGEDHVTKIDLYKNNLTGTIPDEISDLSKLTTLYMDENTLSSNIPTTLGNLNNLLYLNLGGNELSDAIPSELGNLSKLKSLNLGANNLSGTIPSEIGNLSKLEALALPGNNLFGTIPERIFELKNLESLSLGFNELIIELADFAKLNNLKYLHLRNSNLTGTIPGEFFTLVNLEHLYLGNNEFSGDIPTGFGSLVNLKTLELRKNYFSGSIPGELFNLINLRFLDLSQNDLFDSISAEFGNLNKLTTLALNRNKLFGNIPEEMGNLVNLGKLYLDHNDLGGEIPTSLTNLSKLSSPYVDIGYNCLYTNNPGLRAWLESVDPDWESHQDDCTSHTLYIKSAPETGVAVTVSPNDNNGAGNGTTNFTRIYNSGTLVTLTAPAIHSNKSFIKWVVDGVDKEDSKVTIEVTMDDDHSARAVYQASTYTLAVQSSPNSGVKIEVSPKDIYNLGEGETEFFRTYNIGTPVTLTAPGENFVKWLIDGEEHSEPTVEVEMDSNHTAHAVYQSPTYTLAVSSSPSPGIDIEVSPADNNGEGDEKTPFTRIYDSGTEVILTTPPSFDGRDFSHWTVNETVIEEENVTVIVTMDSNCTAEVSYENPNSPEISVSKTHLCFGHIEGSYNWPKEIFTISNSGGKTLNWTVTCRVTDILLNPTVGKDSGEVEVTYNAAGLSPGKFEGNIWVEAPDAQNKVVTYVLWVKSPSQASPPFGDFSTPMDGSTVSGSVPLTGWALDDTGIEKLEIYRDAGEVYDYIGKAVFVEGARQDIRDQYPDYPMNYKAGWGYMMLTNFLPNGGNGTFKILARATDKEGRTTDLGVKTIIVDNANAVKPFGAIDTPAAGGTASGSNYRNYGWVLTPGSNKIPEDGSTINVYVDGVNLGHPVYNVYRPDIAELFPGYTNSDGAGGYFDIDTTTYANGIHTICWTAQDNAGNSDGIGSRYFSIQNPQGARSTAQGAKFTSIGGELQELVHIPVDYSIPVGVVKGYRPDAEPRYMYPDRNGKITIEITQLGRVEVRLMPIGALHDAALQQKLTHPVKWEGYQVVGTHLRPLPIGSTLDIQRGIFYWLPGVGFLKDHEFVFVKTRGNEINKTRVKVTILPE